MSAELTLIGNEGFHLRTASADIFIDAFHRAVPETAWQEQLKAGGNRQALILVTHCHWDHFDTRQVAQAAARLGARIIGPRSVTGQLEKHVAPGALIELEPPLARKSGMAESQSAQEGPVHVSAYRTFHSRDHNSYLVEAPGFRFFHDGDNEDTRRIEAAGLGRLDALLIGPWQGSGWAEFIEKLAPTRYFLMHLTEEELSEHEAGAFLPGICERVPDGLVVLWPGEAFVFP